MSGDPDRRPRSKGRLVLDDRVADGTIRIEGDTIAEVTLVDGPATGAALPPGRPFLAPGFVDVHVHGWGGHDAMGDRAALDGMARALLRRGVTSFLPTAVTAPLGALAAFAERVRAWLPDAPADGAEPLGFNLEGPFLAEARRGAHDPAYLRAPGATSRARRSSRSSTGSASSRSRPSCPARSTSSAGSASAASTISIGHSAATFEEARAGYDAGATSTTHLFNAMSGVDHRAPGLAVAALARRRGVRRAHRRRHPRRPGAVAAHHAPEAGRPAASPSATRSAWPGPATGAAGSAGSTSRSRASG